MRTQKDRLARPQITFVHCYISVDVAGIETSFEVVRSVTFNGISGMPESGINLKRIILWKRH